MCHGCWGCFGCSGCYGGVSVASAPVVVTQPVVVARAQADSTTTPLTDRERAAVREVLRNLRQGGGSEETSSQDVARLTVRVPAEARLYVDGVLVPMNSETRSFHTPRLQRGREYYYTLRAEVDRDGETMTQTRRVTVAAGRQVRVELNDLRTVSTVQR